MSCLLQTSRKKRSLKRGRRLARRRPTLLDRVSGIKRMRGLLSFMMMTVRKWAASKRVRRRMRSSMKEMTSWVVESIRVVKRSPDKSFGVLTVVWILTKYAAVWTPGDDIGTWWIKSIWLVRPNLSNFSYLGTYLVRIFRSWNFSLFDQGYASRVSISSEMRTCMVTVKVRLSHLWPVL